jgi:Uma2 family endonuclease
MTISTSSPESLLIDIGSNIFHVTPEQFDQLCLQNPELRLELTKDRKLIVMPPTGADTGRKNFSLALQVGIWNEQTQLGEAFDSSTGYDFTAIDGGKLSPDVSWIEKSRVGEIPIGFMTVVPDFVIELRSASDNLSPLQEKMQEYQRLGVKLGLLIDPRNQQLEIYRPGKSVEILESPALLNCEEVMPGFVLDLVRAGIWPGS